MRIREPVNGASHLTGLLLAGAGTCLLLRLAHGTAQVAAFSIYGATLILLYAASGLYHSLPLSERPLRALRTLDHTRPGVAAMAVGIARAAFEFAIGYAKQRVQFGVPIAMHQAIQFMIADMATDIEAARLLSWQSAVTLDQGRRNTLQSSHAKRFAADAAMRITTDAVQVYGGYGFIRDYPVEKLMRDAKIMQLYEGTSQIQRLVIARETLLPRRVEERPAVAA